MKGVVALYERVAGVLPLFREIMQIRDGLRHLNANITRLHAMLATTYLEGVSADPRMNEPGRLQHLHEAQINSQNGEDGILREIFRRIGAKDNVFVEIGVGDGRENNTSFLIAQGWTGYWIDGSDKFTSTLHAASARVFDAVRYKVSHVAVENVCSILHDLGVPIEFDFLSIDIDQNTYHVWSAMGAYRPRVAAVEYNAALPADIHWHVDYDPARVWDGSQCFGASLKALEMLGKRMGYLLVGCDSLGINAFFVREDLVGDHFCAPYTAENHYIPPRYEFAHRKGHPRAILDVRVGCESSGGERDK